VETSGTIDAVPIKQGHCEHLQFDSPLYQLQNSGRIYKRVSAGGGSFRWELLDNNPATVSITAHGDDGLYQIHNNGGIHKYTGTPCDGSGCHGWEMIDNNSRSVRITAGLGGRLYQLHDNGGIFEALGANNE